MGDEADRLIEQQMNELPYYQARKRKASRTLKQGQPVGVADLVVEDYIVPPPALRRLDEEEEGPREPSTRTTCNRCGTPRLHWTGDKQAGTLVMRDEHGFEHKCPTFGVQLSLGQPK